MRRSRFVLLVGMLLVALLATGCLVGQNGDDGVTPSPDDGSSAEETAADGANETGRASDDQSGEAGEVAADDGNGTSEDGSGDIGSLIDDENATSPDSVPSIDEREVADHVRRMVDEYRQTAGFREVRHTQGVVITADSINRGMIDREVAPPLEADGTGLDLSEDELLTQFKEDGSGECERETDEVVGLVTAARHVPTLVDEGRGQGATLEERLADDIVFTWKRSAVTADDLEDDYRFIGVDTRYDEDRGVAYVTAGFC